MNADFRVIAARPAVDERLMGRCIVQIYEVQSPQEAEAVVALGVDRVGSVVLSAAGWKQPEVKETIARVRACGAWSSLIPLYSDLDAVARTLDYYRPNIVHFCDAIPVGGGCGHLIEFQFRVKERFPEITVMRSIPIGTSDHAQGIPSLDWARRLEPATDVFLTDTLLVGPDAGGKVEQPVKGFVGITGRTCDWEIAAHLVQQSRNPVILAGGISPQNAAEAVVRLRPAGIDSCTLTNAQDADGRPIRFKKDLQKVKALVEAVRRAEIMS
jgi:phosphoribosylanthranilate isomerase